MKLRLLMIFSASLLAACIGATDDGPRAPRAPGTAIVSPNVSVTQAPSPAETPVTITDTYDRCLFFNDPARVHVPRGGSATATVLVNRPGCAGSVTISSVDVDGVTVDPVTVPDSIDTVEVTFRAADPAWSVLPAHLLGDAGSWRDWGTFTLVVDDVAPASIFSGRPALLSRDLLIDGAVGDGERVVLVGTSRSTGAVVVVRFDDEGFLDATFGDSGIARLPGTAGEFPVAMIVLRDHRIRIALNVAAGGVVETLSEDGTLETGARFTTPSTVTGLTGGAIDDGVVALSGSSGSDLIRFVGDAPTTFATGFAGAGQPLEYADGRVLWVFQSPNGFRLEATRVTPDGTIDPSFGTNGLAVLRECPDDPNGHTVYGSAALDARGRLLYFSQCWVMDAHDGWVVARSGDDGYSDGAITWVGSLWYWPATLVSSADGTTRIPTTAFVNYCDWDCDGDNFAIRTLADDGSTVLSTRDVGVNEYDVALIQTPTGHIIEVGNMTNAEFTARVPVIVCMEGCS